MRSPVFMYMVAWVIVLSMHYVIGPVVITLFYIGLFCMLVYWMWYHLLICSLLLLMIVVSLGVYGYWVKDEIISRSESDGR
jgi:hypothetical protein